MDQCLTSLGPEGDREADHRTCRQKNSKGRQREKKKKLYSLVFLVLKANTTESIFIFIPSLAPKLAAQSYLSNPSVAHPLGYI